MKILTDKQIADADRATIERENITPIDLVERAAEEIARWIGENIDAGHRLIFCCGRGGNGSDGVAAARMLARVGRECVVVLTGDVSADRLEALKRLPKGVKLYYFSTQLPDIEPDDVIMDALMGVGFTGEVRQPMSGVIKWLNDLPNRVISIDLPSGMGAGWPAASTETLAVSAETPVVPTATPAVSAESTPHDFQTERSAASRLGDKSDRAGLLPARPIVRAETTLTLQFPKIEMLLAESGECAGRIVVLPIGLDEEFLDKADTPYLYITEEWVESLRLPRAKFSHKGDYGHALLVCGSVGMPGAAILATGGALRSGCGLVTTHLPGSERFTLTANHPSAMLSLDAADFFSQVPTNLGRFTAIGVGCGLGQDPATVNALAEMLRAAKMVNPGATELTDSINSAKANSKKPADRTTADTAIDSTTDALASRSLPMVLDADALNIIAAHPSMRSLIAAGSILTPHSGELRRLVGPWTSERDKLKKASTLAAETRSAVIVKGTHSVVCTSDGSFVFNSTGNAGMAKGGSGDVLAGYVTGLLARGYDAVMASIIGVYIHGQAGDKAAEYYGVEAMNSDDLAEFLQ